VEIPEADPVLAAWRPRHDPSAAAGVPAHVTVLFPFVEPDALDAKVDARLRALAAGHRPVDVTFRRVAGFDDVVWLAPEPDAPFRALTADAWARFPACPPYGARFAEVIPHLTIGRGDPATMAALLREVEHGLRGRLPLRVRVESLSLFVERGGRWSRRRSFRLAG
jgi:2'-5' RNA ligase